MDWGKGENTIRKQPSIRRNFLMNAILRAANVIFPLITIPYISRILLPVGMGRVSFATSFVAYFNMAAQLGVPSYGIRACAKVRDDRRKLSQVTMELLILTLAGTVIAYLTLALCILFIPRVWDDRMLFIVISTTVFLNSIGMEWLYKGLEQYTYITVRSLIFKTIALLAVFLLIRNQDDVLVYAGISIFASSASNILNFAHAHRLVDFHTRQGVNLHRHIKPVLVLFAMVCAVTLFTNLDEVMLGFIRTKAEVGYYQAAVRIKVALVDVITALSVVLMPRASYYVEHGMKEEFQRITDKGMHFVLLSSAGLMVYFMLFAKETISCLFGAAFDASILPMILIMPNVMLTGMTRVMGNQILIPQGQEKIVLYSVAAGAAVDVVLNALLIPNHGPAGAVFGTVAAELVIVMIQYPKVRKDVSGVVRRFISWKIAGALVLSAGASLWVKALPIGLLYRLALSSILFFVVYIAFLLITKETMVVEVFGWMIKKMKRVNIQHHRDSERKRS